MFKYSKKTKMLNIAFIAIILFLIGLVLIGQRDLIYLIILFFILVLLARDAYKEYYAFFDVLDDRLQVRVKDKVIKDIYYKDAKYLTITKKNKKWVVIANEDKVMFTIKPKIEDYETMIKKLIKNMKNYKNVVIHDQVLFTYSAYNKNKQDIRTF